MSSRAHTTQLQLCLDKMLAGEDSHRELLIDHAYERLRLLVRSRMATYPGLRRWEQTDDVLQQASERLWKSLDAVKPTTVREFFGLAATQIRRTLIDLVRHYYGPEGLGANQDTNLLPGGKLCVEVEKADPTGDPLTLIEWTEFHATVDRLPEEQGELFNLLYYHGIAQAEAAELLGMSPRTLKRHWREARQAVFRAMHGDGPTL